MTVDVWSLRDYWPLLSACLAAPGDHLPRLVLADYLDDTGKPAAVDQAEFLRLGVEVERQRAAGLHLAQRTKQSADGQWKWVPTPYGRYMDMHGVKANKQNTYRAARARFLMPMWAKRGIWYWSWTAGLVGEVGLGSITGCGDLLPVWLADLSRLVRCQPITAVATVGVLQATSEGNVAGGLWTLVRDGLTAHRHNMPNYCVIDDDRVWLRLARDPRLVTSETNMVNFRERSDADRALSEAMIEAAWEIDPFDDLAPPEGRVSRPRWLPTTFPRVRPE